MGTSLKSAGRSSRQAPAQFKRQAHKHPQRARCALRAHGNSVTHENAEASDREGYIASTPPRRRFKLSQIIDASQHYPARMAPLIGRRMHREARCALRAHQNQQPCQDAFAGERDGYISEIYGQIVPPSAAERQRRLNAKRPNTRNGLHGHFALTESPTLARTLKPVSAKGTRPV